ncbi:mitochondrial zinc maintenance protein 1, mitochondrial [[Candida] railenensis]|uniref:Mitochondrial zinc maintenance protein 1, mitochondrial n=1 Tax=[Candida] railenensis TaxID=45579 RepID=A0A9P0QRI8_9ASCO|nr:mitochondrial zinc maintenance protein 1, mitochondrial [[Candida] railenensis]
MSRSAALSAYKNLLKATKVSFKNDAEVLFAARSKIRSDFLQERELDSKIAQEKIDHANAVAKFLVANVVQGIQKEEGKYLLDIHEQTELGDNETIKQKKSEMGSLAGAKATKRCS